jgi:hypothetical protein
MAKDNATSASPSGNVHCTAKNTPQHKRMAEGYKPKPVGGPKTKP